MTRHALSSVAEAAEASEKRERFGYSLSPWRQRCEVFSQPNSQGFNDSLRPVVPPPRQGQPHVSPGQSGAAVAANASPWENGPPQDQP